MLRTLLFLAAASLTARATLAGPLTAGAATINITPSQLPVRQNGGFLEAQARRVIDPLHARALVLESESTRVAIVVVDSCMLPRNLCDRAKDLASRETGIPRERILISATHTHSAPGAMDYCLGSRADPAYTASLPPRLAQVIVDADAARTPAELGYTVVHAPEHTNCRRWIRRPDRIATDPFGERTVRAMMHPGYQNPDYIGPSGPVDTGLSLLSVRRVDGTPLAVLGNFSMHYFGVGGGLSADHCGAFARKIAARLAPDHGTFVGILSQGTSGDLHWMDYSRPRRSIDLDGYTDGLVDIAVRGIETIRYRREIDLAMAETRLAIDRRRPDANRLAWARRVLPDRERRPRNRPEVYAEQAFFIDENPREEIVLQAIRIGALGITGIPNEVYGLTGLELKARSPLQPTFNIELANGAAGYIPPPEQHFLGGYTTWPARTAGLEIEAEPRIVDTLLALLERVAGDQRREPTTINGAYPANVLGDRPLAYFRLEDFRGPTLRGEPGASLDARATPGCAFHLEGPASAAFSEERINRSLHLAGGHVEISELPETFATSSTVELWFWNGLEGAVKRERSVLTAFGAEEVSLVPAEDDRFSRVAIGDQRGDSLIPGKTWSHLAVCRSPSELSVFVNGRRELRVVRPPHKALGLRIGAGESRETSFEGKIDELALFGRTLTPNVLARHFAVSGIQPPTPPPAPTGFMSRTGSAADNARVEAMLLAAKPIAYWKLFGVGGERDRVGTVIDSTLEENASVGSATDAAANFRGGRLRAKLPALGDRYSFSIWFRNDLAHSSRPVTGYFFSRGADLADGAPGEHLGIGGTHLHAGRLIVFNGNRREQLIAGRTPLRRGAWNHVVFAREGRRVRVFLNGDSRPDAEGDLDATYPREGPTELFLGGRNDRFANFHGRLEHAAIFHRALTGDEARELFLASGLSASNTTSTAKPTKLATVPKPDSEPRSPQETLRATSIREGFRLELVAAEPLVRDPVAIDWDTDGRLWVVEMADYPYGMDGKGKPGGRVRFLESQDASGRYRESTLFADGLNFPTGLLPWRSGVIVSAAPDILYLEDTNGDGRADLKKVLFTGFLPGNQQLRVNSPRWGLDGWVHFASGGHHAGYGSKNHVRSTRTGETIALGSRDFRVRPDLGILEPLSGPSQFGRIRNDWGDWFGVQNSFPLWHYVLEDHHARRNPHVASPGARHQIRGSNPRLYPAKRTQKRYHSYEHATTFTSACGPSIYRDEILFPRDETTHAFTCDPFHSLVQHSLVERDGVTFRGEADTQADQSDFFASADRWCRPVMTRTGPDGALYVVDMYRYMIEHPDWLPAAGREELEPFYRSGEDRGRIYRIVPEGPNARSPRKAPRITGRSAADLVDLLGHPSGSVRDRAHRLLTEDLPASSTERIRRMASSDPRPLARLHALAIIASVLPANDEFLIARLRDPHPQVVRLALRIVERARDSREIVEAAAKLTDHIDAGVRLQLAKTLGAWSGETAGRALGDLAVNSGDDAWIRAAILSSALDHQESLVRALIKDSGDSLRPFATALTSLSLKTRKLDVLASILATLIDAPPADTSIWKIETLATLLDELTTARTSLEALGEIDAGIAELVVPIQTWIAAARPLALSRTAALERRTAAVRLLGRRRENRSEDEKLLSSRLDPSTPSAMQIAIIGRLRALGTDPEQILSRWPTLAPEARTAAAQSLLSRADWILTFLDRIESGGVPRSTVSPSERRQLTSHRHPKIAHRARELFQIRALEGREATLRALRPAIGLNGIAARGQEVFAKNCGNCHRAAGVGHEIGPDVRALSNRSAEAYLEAIVDPSAAVEPKYLTYSAVLADGQVIQGLIRGETGNSLTLRLADGTDRTVLRSEIRRLESTESSFMPDGLTAALSLRDVADLLAFLREN